MAGFLDGLLNNDQSALGAFLLAAAGPRAQPASFGQRLLEAMQGAQQYRDSREDRSQRARMQEMQGQLLQAQIAETQAQQQQRAADAEQRRQAMARQQQFQTALGSLFGPTTPQQALASGGGPTMANAARIGQPQQGGPNWQQLAAQFPDQVDLLKKLSEAQNFGRQEVARTEDTMRDGRPVRQQLDKFGQPVGDPLAQWKAPLQVDTGGAVTFRDPFDPARLVASIGKTMTPDGAASNAIARGNLDLSRQRLIFDMQQPRGQYDAERGLLIDTRAGTATPVTQNGQPVGAKVKDMTDAQAMALLFGERMKAADAIIGRQSAAGTNMPGLTRSAGMAMQSAGLDLLGGAVGGIGNVLQSGAEQSVEQAQRDFINAVLRRESGAVISPQEFANARQQYFFAPGDTEEQIKQKAENRRLATELMLREVPGGHRMSAPAAASAPGRVRFLGFEN